MLAFTEDRTTLERKPSAVRAGYTVDGAGPSAPPFLSLPETPLCDKLIPECASGYVLERVVRDPLGQWSKLLLDGGYFANEFGGIQRFIVLLQLGFNIVINVR